MNDFQIGDRVMRTCDEWYGMKPGDTATVRRLFGTEVGLDEYGGQHSVANLSAVATSGDKAVEQDPNGTDTATTKASNPKQAFGDLKAQLALVPDTLQYAAAPAFFEGASKYGAYNWRAAGVRASTYKAACERHLKKWFNGELCDPKTGVPHLSNAIACLAIIVDAQVAGKLHDDRPPAIDLLGLEEAVAAVQDGVREQHKDKSPKHWTQKDME